MSQAYRGYAIIHNVVYDLFYVRKNGVNIGTFQSLDDAKAAIDSLLS